MEKIIKPINLGIFAHVDAGKTTITENILHKTGVIKSIGRVDSGNTQTDSMELERKRGISIRSATTSFHINDLKVNLIDTPGHIDFIAEVERTLNILDCAILVISGKEGVQTQTKVLWKALTNLEIPTIIFINKLDRLGASSVITINEIKKELSQNLIILQESNNDATALLEISDNELKPSLEVLCDLDDSLMSEYLKDQVTDIRIEESISMLTKKASCYPVFMGSALLDIGIGKLLNGINKYFLKEEEINDNELSGVVFKIDEDFRKDKITYIRIFEGMIINKSDVSIYSKNKTVKVKGLKTIIDGEMTMTNVVFEGDIAIVYGFEDVEIGDIVGTTSSKLKYYNIPKTTMTSKIKPVDMANLSRLVSILTNLSKQDPLLNFSKNPISNELSVNLVGQIQSEVIESLLREKYGIEVLLDNPEIIYMERPSSKGSSLVKFKDNQPYPAEVELTVEPLPIGSGLVFKSEVSLGYIVKPFQVAVEEAVRFAAKEGIYGWEVTDVLVTFTNAYFNSVDSTASAFRKLTPIVFMEALYDAGTSLIEPRYDFILTVDEHDVGKVMFDLTKMRADISKQSFDSGVVVIKGTVPIETSNDYRIELASLTKGKGIFETEFSGFFESYLKIDKVKERTTVNPINRGVYIRSV